MKNNFELVSEEGDEWLEQSVMVSGKKISIQLRPEDKYFQSALPYAEVILKGINKFASSAQDFIDTEKSKFPAYHDELDQLNISVIAFISREDPTVAEVVFSEVPSGRIWKCAYNDNKFFNLGFDD